MLCRVSGLVFHMDSEVPVITAAFAVLLGIKKKQESRNWVVRCSSPRNIPGYPFCISVCTLQRGHIIILCAVGSL